MRDGRIFKPKALGGAAEIERAFERLVAMEEWLEGSQKKGVGPLFFAVRPRASAT